MPTARIPMRQFIEIMRLKYEAKLSNHRVALAAGVSKGVVSKYLHLAATHGVTWPLPQDTDEAQLERLLFPATAKPSRFAEPDYFQIHQVDNDGSGKRLGRPGGNYVFPRLSGPLQKLSGILC